MMMTMTMMIMIMMLRTMYLCKSSVYVCVSISLSPEVPCQDDTPHWISTQRKSWFHPILCQYLSSSANPINSLGLPTICLSTKNHRASWRTHHRPGQFWQGESRQLKSSQSESTTPNTSKYVGLMEVWTLTCSILGVSTISITSTWGYQSFETWTSRNHGGINHPGIPNIQSDSEAPNVLLQLLKTGGQMFQARSFEPHGLQQWNAKVLLHQQWMVNFIEKPIEMDDSGVTPF